MYHTMFPIDFRRSQSAVKKSIGEKNENKMLFLLVCLPRFGPHQANVEFFFSEIDIYREDTLFARKRNFHH